MNQHTRPGATIFARGATYLLEQLSQSLELSLELSIVVLEYLHARLEAALVLAQQFSLRDHITVRLPALVHTVLGRRARCLRRAQPLVLGLQRRVLLFQIADHRLELFALLSVDRRHNLCDEKTLVNTTNNFQLVIKKKGAYLYRAARHVDAVAAVEAVAVVGDELVLVVAVGRGVAASARQLDFSETRRVDLEPRVHVLAERAVLGRRSGTLESVALEDRLHGQIADSRMLLEVALRLELVAQSSCEVTHILARCRLRKNQKISLHSSPIYERLIIIASI